VQGGQHGMPGLKDINCNRRIIMEQLKVAKFIEAKRDFRLLVLNYFDLFIIKTSLLILLFLLLREYLHWRVLFR